MPDARAHQRRVQRSRPPGTRSATLDPQRIRRQIFDGLTRAFVREGGRTTPVPERRFHKDEEYLVYGVPTPEFRHIMRSFHSRILSLSLRDRLSLARSLLETHIGEPGHAGIYILALSAESLQPRHFGTLDRCVENFRSWSHVDHLALEVMRHLLWNYPGETLTLLECWSRSPLRWKRRASVVTFTRKLAESGRFTGHALRLCKSLAHDTDDLVRKGVGWALKDAMRYAPEKVLRLIKDLKRQNASSTIILYALRGQSEQIRREVLSAGCSDRRPTRIRQYRKGS